ncbi:hypothetical protein [Salaquimonas pukyongi]|uniref:hypothetical protein n=1 Tax=Salaquimonas pukyongi TaxID=2712698 RepID=UPI00096BAF4B|nr:hypothetical protein [Salaquimonas pukyongi]
MKTLIATLIVSLAAATSAFAMDGNQNNLPASLAKDYGASAVQVSGFKGATFDNDKYLDGHQTGIPTIFKAENNTSSVQIFGFRGVAVDNERHLDVNQGSGIPASLR